MNSEDKKLLCLCVAALWSVNAAAQPADEEDELALIYGDKTMVSITTGAAQPLARAPAVATVITAQDIANLESLTIEFADELALLNVKVSTLEDTVAGLKKDVDLIKADTVVIEQPALARMEEVYR